MAPMIYWGRVRETNTQEHKAFILENFDNYFVLISEIYVKIIPSQSDLDSTNKILYRSLVVLVMRQPLVDVLIVGSFLQV